VRLSFDTAWFDLSPNRCFGAHPKRGTLNREDRLKRAPWVAILEAKNVE
jgi:hypothetical protein